MFQAPLHLGGHEQQQTTGLTLELLVGFLWSRRCWRRRAEVSSPHPEASPPVSSHWQIPTRSKQSVWGTPGRKISSPVEALQVLSCQESRAGVRGCSNTRTKSLWLSPTLVLVLLLFQSRKIGCEERLIFVSLVTLQGMTIRPLVDLLAVKRKRESAPTVGEQIHIRVSGASINMWPELSDLFWNVCVSRDPADLQFYPNPLQLSPFPCWKSYSGS